MCKPTQERTSNIHVSYLYLEVMTTMAIADCFLGDACDTAVDYQSSLI